MPYSNFPGGFAAGLTVRGTPITVANPGKVFWVYNGSALQSGQRGGSDGNKGTYDSPFSTLDYAIGQCVADRGDIIYIKPGHAESVIAAGTITLDVAGVAIVGLGSGSNRPTFTYTTINSASIKVLASNISIQNCLFVSAIAACATVFSNTNAVVAKDFSVERCEFRDSSTTLNFVSQVIIGTTANQGDGLNFSGNKVFSIMGTPTAATTCVVSGAAMDRYTLNNNTVYRAAALNNTAVLLAMGANNHTNLTVSGNRTHTPNTGTTAGELVSGGSTGSNGMLSNNYCWHLASSGLIAPLSTKLAFVENYCSITGAADKSALINPVAV